MTAPDRLEQVLAKLDALELEEQSIGTELARNFGVRFEGVLLTNHRFLRTKLRAAMEMEKAGQKIISEYPALRPQAAKWYAIRELQAALAAWQQAGEELEVMALTDLYCREPEMFGPCPTCADSALARIAELETEIAALKVERDEARLAVTELERVCVRLSAIPK